MSFIGNSLISVAHAACVYFNWFNLCTLERPKCTIHVLSFLISIKKHFIKHVSVMCKCTCFLLPGLHCKWFSRRWGLQRISLMLLASFLHWLICSVPTNENALKCDQTLSNWHGSRSTSAPHARVQLRWSQASSWKLCIQQNSS